MQLFLNDKEVRALLDILAEQPADRFDGKSAVIYDRIRECEKKQGKKRLSVTVKVTNSSHNKER